MSTTTQTMGLTVPSIADTIPDFVGGIAASMAVIDALYPVGTIYQSTAGTDPSTFIGGTWTRLQGRVLVGAGTDFPAGSTGGEKEHVLTVAELPAHSHSLSLEYGTSGVQSNPPGGQYSQVSNTDPSSDVGCGSAGSGAAHENMPPYKAVYMWERTA